MWITMLLFGWLTASLLAGPWIGRFVVRHAQILERPPAINLPAEARPEPEPVKLARRA